MKVLINLNSSPSLFRDPRPCALRAVHFITSLARQILSSLRFLCHRHALPNAHRQDIKWPSNSQGLVVLLHGLRSDPTVWEPQLSLLKKEREIDIFAPVVPNRGMCSLSEAATPILPTLLDYIKKNPQKPVCILGASNGSRIATWLEIKLREKAPATPVMISTIAGVHLGSSRMDLLEKWGLARYFYPPALQQELRYCSLKAKELLNQVRQPLPLYCAQRKYEFYATTEDLSVPNLDSSLPEIGKGERFYVVFGHSHDSIVPLVARNQISSCLAWIRNRG